MNHHVIFTARQSCIIKKYGGSHHPSSWRLPARYTWTVHPSEMVVRAGQKVFIPFALEAVEGDDGYLSEDNFSEFREEFSKYGDIEVAPYQGGYPRGCPNNLNTIAYRGKELPSFGADDVPKTEIIAA